MHYIDELYVVVSAGNCMLMNCWCEVSGVPAPEFDALLWSVYSSWVIEGTAVMAGEQTWPLPFHGDSSITQLLRGTMSWNDTDIGAFEVAQFDTMVPGLHKGCSRDEVTWPDIQAVFRHALCQAAGTKEWSDTENQLYPALEKRNRLQYRIEKHEIQRRLLGSWRVYCKQGDGGEPFSYGLVISEVDEETLTFKGRSRKPGRYEVGDGKVEYVEGGRQQVVLSYYEVYPDGQRKHVQGRLKCNGKIQCIVEGGTTQKARREDSCTAALEAGEEDVIKYFAQELDVFENAKKRRQMAVKVCAGSRSRAACMHACMLACGVGAVQGALA